MTYCFGTDDHSIKLFLDTAFEGEIEEVEKLLDQGFKPDLADTDSTTALQIAAAQGDLDLVSFSGILH